VIFANVVRHTTLFEIGMILGYKLTVMLHPSSVVSEERTMMVIRELAMARRMTPL
jgi:hypothetical protein